MSPGKCCTSYFYVQEPTWDISLKSWDHEGGEGAFAADNIWVEVSAWKRSTGSRTELWPWGFGTHWSIVSSWLETFGICSLSTWSLKWGSGITAAAPPESSLEMANPRRHSRPTESNLHFNKVIYILMYILMAVWEVHAYSTFTSYVAVLGRFLQLASLICFTLTFINVLLRSMWPPSLKFQQIPTCVQCCPSVVLYSEDKELNFRDIRKGESLCELEWPKMA